MIDVRGDSEWNDGHLPHATHLFLANLVDRARDMARDTPITVFCQGGTRSAIAASLLQANGFTNVVNMKDGIDGWKAAGLPIDRPSAHTP